MAVLNQILNAGFDALLWPVQTLPWWVGVCWLGLPAAAFALLVFRLTSNQTELARAKDRVKAHLLELLLFRDDLGVSLRAQASILRANLGYLRHTLLPLAVMIGPFLLVLVQVESRFALRAYAPGEAILVRLTLAEGIRPSSLDTGLEVVPAGTGADGFEPAGLRRETPGLRIDRTGEVVWRLRALRAGEHALQIAIGDAKLDTRIRVGAGPEPLVPATYAHSDPRLLLAPEASPLNAAAGTAALRAVEIDYPAAHAFTLGLSSAGWLFFAASVVAGFALRRPFGVEL